MRYAILSDIHANLPALEAVLADASTAGYDALLVLGDLVGYGADPAAVVDRTLSLAPAGLIRGNHDKVCAGLAPADTFNDLARLSIDWTIDVLPTATIAALAALPAGPLRIGREIEIAHGAPFDEDFYVLDHRDAARALASASAPICLVGHTHVPALFADGGDVPVADGDAVILPRRGRVLVNVGSVGQPRDGDSRAAYGLLDLERRMLRIRRVTYDIGAAQRAIMDAGLPVWLAIRLEHGE